MTGDEQARDWLACMEVWDGEREEAWRILADHRTDHRTGHRASHRASHRGSRPVAQQEQRREQHGLSTD